VLVLRCRIFGGSADLTGSNNTLFKGARTLTAADESGDYLHYGVREFGMTAIMNGIALHGGFIPTGHVPGVLRLCPQCRAPPA
jgi:transketolase